MPNPLAKGPHLSNFVVQQAYHFQNEECNNRQEEQTCPYTAKSQLPLAISSTVIDAAERILLQNFPDFFAKDRTLPPVKRGDLLSIFTAGAYGFSMSSNYNARPRAAEVLVDGSKFTLIRKRETYEDLTAMEK